MPFPSSLSLPYLSSRLHPSQKGSPFLRSLLTVQITCYEIDCSCIHLRSRSLRTVTKILLWFYNYRCSCGIVNLFHIFTSYFRSQFYSVKAMSFTNGFFNFELFINLILFILILNHFITIFHSSNNLLIFRFYDHYVMVFEFQFHKLGSKRIFVGQSFPFRN